MRSAGAATRREQEPPLDAAAVIAGLGQVIAGSGEIHGKLARHERRIASLAGQMERLSAQCGDPQLAVLAGELRDVLTTVAVELISDAAHCAELREQAEALAPLVAFREMMTDALIAEGRRLEAAERAAAEQPRPRHRHRKPHLTVLTGSVAAASLAAVSAGGAYVAQDSALVHHVTAARPAVARFHAGPADSAVPVPSWSPPAKPTVAARSAHPAPKVTAVPVPSFVPPPAPAPSPVASSPPPPPPPPPDLIVPPELHLDGTQGTLTLTAGDQGAAWTVDASPGLSVGVRGGVLAPGQSVQVEVSDGPGVAGWLYVSWGQQTVAVEVTSSLAPGVALR